VDCDSFQSSHLVIVQIQVLLEPCEYEFSTSLVFCSPQQQAGEAEALRHSQQNHVKKTITATPSRALTGVWPPLQRCLLDILPSIAPKTLRPVLDSTIEPSFLCLPRRGPVQLRP
jgi:hypothetical protein